MRPKESGKVRYAYGVAMIGTVHACWKLKYLGRVIEDRVVSTDVWVREGNRWMSIRRHSTPAPAKADHNKGK